MVCHIVTRRRDNPEDDEGEERKERVIHTRVPESLEAELRQRAQGLGISVSNLVRNVLGHTFGLVGDVVADSQAIARAARGEAAKAAPAAAAASLDDVLGWQRIVLAKNAVCAKCNAILPKGQDAAVGVNTQIVICPPCLTDLT